MSETGNLKETVGKNFMAQMKNFKDNGQQPVAPPVQAQTAEPPKPADPTNPVPKNDLPPANPEPQPKEGTADNVKKTFEYKGVKNQPSNAPLPLTDAQKAAQKEEPAKPVEAKKEEGKEDAASKADAPEAADTDKGDDPKSATTEPKTLNEDAVREFLKEKYGKEVESIETLFKEPEPTVDPFEGLDEETKGFIAFNKDTGRPYSDYVEAKKDWSKVDPVDVARQQAIEKSGGVLNQKNVDEYLEKKLGITDLSDLDTTDKAELNIYNSDFVKTKMAEREKYATPTEAKVESGKPKEKMITLDTGALIPESKYNELVDSQKQYHQALKSASEKLEPTKLSVAFDDNGTKRNFELSYDPNSDEKAEILSYASDPINALKKMFTTKDGANLAGVQEAMLFANPKTREKAVTAMINQALAQFAEQIAKLKSNANYSQNRMPSTAKPATTDDNPFIRQQNARGIAFPKELFRK